MNKLLSSGFFLLLGATSCSSTDPVQPGGGGGSAGSTAGTSGAATAGNGVGGSLAGAGPGGMGGTAGTPTLAGAGGGGAAAGGAHGGGGSGGVGGVAGAGGAGGGAAGGGGDQIPKDYKGTPFGGKPQVIPGKIEAELYDLGGEQVAFHNTRPAMQFDGCNVKRTDAAPLFFCIAGVDKMAPDCKMPAPAGDVYLGYIVLGEWYKYTVDVAESATYVISGHEGVQFDTAAVSIDFTPTLGTGTIKLPSTDTCGGYEAYHIWATHPNLAEITLPAGKYVMTLTVVGAGMNLDGFTFTKK